MQFTQTLNPGKVIRWLGLIALYLALQSLLTEYLLEEVLRGSSDSIIIPFIDLFSVNAEQTIPTWYAAVQLFVTAVLLGVITAVKHHSRDPYTRYWTGLTFIFLYLSMDEGAVIHEIFSDTLDLFYNPGGYLTFAWLIVFVPLVILFGLLYLRFLFHLPSRIRNLFILAGLFYVGGAVIVEAISANRYALDGGVTFPYLAIATVEELLEMWGVVLFIYALLSYAILEGMTAVFTPTASLKDDQTPVRLRRKHLRLATLAFLLGANILLVIWALGQQTAPVNAADTPFYQLVTDRFDGQGVVILGINEMITADNPAAPSIANALLTLFEDVMVITLADDQISIAFASSHLPFNSDTLSQLAQQSGETNFTILSTPTLRTIAAHTNAP
jgi:hypothetical protein